MQYNYYRHLVMNLCQYWMEGYHIGSNGILLKLAQHTVQCTSNTQHLIMLIW